MLDTLKRMQFLCRIQFYKEKVQSFIQKKSFYLFNCEAPQLWVADDPETGNDGGVDQGHHGDVKHGLLLLLLQELGPDHHREDSCDHRHQQNAQEPNRETENITEFDIDSSVEDMDSDT